MIGAIYKPGQGYWTRLFSVIGLALLVLMGVVWLVGLLANTKIAGMEPVIVQGGAAVLVIAVFLWIGYSLIGCKPRVVDFMIATEGEMKKVNWSTKKEIYGSTWVVIGLTAFLAVLCFVFDLLFQIIFTWMGVLKT
jgi:preprotein translocase subunit SecE